MEILDNLVLASTLFLISLPTFVTGFIRGGEDLVTIAELTGHSRLETLRVYSRPTETDKHNALRHLTVDR